MPVREGIKLHFGYVCIKEGSISWYCFLRCFGHVERMDEARSVKQAYLGKMNSCVSEVGQGNNYATLWMRLCGENI